MATRHIIPTSPFLLNGEHHDADGVPIELDDNDAAAIVHAGRARFATPDEVTRAARGAQD